LQRIAAAGLAIAMTALPAESHSAAQSAPSDSSRRIVFERVDDQTGTSAIYVIDSDGTDESLLAAPAIASETLTAPDLSPDGSRALFTHCEGQPGPSHCKIVEIGIDGTGERVVPLPGSPTDRREPVWSPDGARFAYVELAAPDDPSVVGARVKVARLDGTGVRDVGPGYEVEWSPSGALLVVESVPPPVPGGFGSSRLVTRAADGSGRRELRSFPGGVAEAAWSPDGQRIALVYDPPNSQGIAEPYFTAVLNADGSGLRPGPGGGTLGGVAWAPSSERLLVDGRLFDLAGNEIDSVSETPPGFGSVFPSWALPTGSGAACVSGYWLVAADGGIFTFGDARFHGSASALGLPDKVVSMATTGSGGGYWLAAANGRVLTFGDAPPLGDAIALGANGGLGAPVVAATGSVLLAASDGQVVPLGGTDFCGSAWKVELSRPVVGAAATPTALTGRA
jgi:Tol biopolymer transport system component